MKTPNWRKLNKQKDLDIEKLIGTIERFEKERLSFLEN